MVRGRRLPLVLWSILLGLALQAAPAQAAKSKSSKIDVNTATQQELEALPGIGEATAKKIIAGRPYSSVDDLGRAGVPAVTLAKVKSRLTVGAAAKPAAPAASSPKSGAPTAASKPSSPSASKSGAATARPEKVDVNTATEQQLEALPGIGEATAKKIIAGRPYTSLKDLSRAGVTGKTLDKAKPYLSISRGRKAASTAAAEPPAAAGSSAPAAPAQSHAPSPAQSRAAASSAPPPESSGEATAPRTAPAAGMVWVNTATRVYHREGDPWYGKTKEGKFMSEPDAIRAGYRASKQGAPKTN